MTKLNQIIAIEKGVKSRTYGAISELYKLIQKPELFSGGVRQYEKKFDEGEDLPTERQHVQFSIEKILDQFRKANSELINVTAQKDKTNMSASAAIEVDGVRIDGVPVTTLLFLEKQLSDLRSFVEKLPVLDNAHDWQRDEGSGLYKSAPRQTQRTKKVQKPIVLYEATDKHPAQTQMITEDETVGYWNTVLHSTAVPLPQKQELCERVDRLLIAVKQAREKANDIEAVERQTLGEAIFDYLGIGG